MTEQVISWGLRLVFVVVTGAALLLVVKLAGRALAILPVSRAERAALGRGAPVIGALALGSFAILAVRWLLDGRSEFEVLVFGSVLAAAVVAAWGPLRDAVSGVVVKAGAVCHVGDTIAVGELRGRVVAMGHRALTLEAAGGEQIVLPYSKVTAASVLRVPVLTGAQAHVFDVELPPGIDVAAAMLSVERSALRCHWSSIVRIPEVDLRGASLLRVTVFPLVMERAVDIETHVRAALDGSSSRSR